MKINKKITIIIAIFNGISSLESCLLSCLNQTYPFELIIIDGASFDGTIKMLESYSDRISYWISEPDNGIYSAWNKALKKATGDWICFIGCDDYWVSENSLEKLAQTACYPEFNLISGKIHLVNTQGVILKSIGKPFDYSKLTYGMHIAHPGALHHRSLFDEHGYFDENYKISGDYEFLLRISAYIRSAFVPEHLICMGNTGLSNKKLHRTINEGAKALLKTKGFGGFAALKLYCTSYLALLKSFIV